MGHLAFGGLLLLGFSYFWKSRKQRPLDLSTFLTALSVYTLSMLSTPLGWHDHPMMTSLIFLVGIYLYILLVYKMKLPYSLDFSEHYLHCLFIIFGSCL